MLNTLNVLIIGLIFVKLDFIPLYQKEEWVSFFLNCSLLALAIIIAVLLDFNVEIPNPSDYIKKIITFIYGLE